MYNKCEIWRFLMNIKCIALDLDRTTLNASGRLSDGNYNALCHAIENGVHIVIASGRSFDTLPKDVLAVPGIEYAITSNGAAIYHIPTSTCLHEYKMTPASVECIIQIAKQHETALEVFIDGKAYALKAYVEDPVSYGTTPQAIPYIQSTRIPIDDIISFIREYLNLKPEETAAFGDGDNDIDLLKEAGIGIAMENASSKCKDAATFITKHHDKDGVAYGITEFLKI